MAAPGEHAEQEFETVMRNIKSLLGILRAGPRVNLENSEKLMQLVQDFCHSIRQLLDTGHIVYVNSNGDLMLHYSSRLLDDPDHNSRVTFSRRERFELRRRLVDAFEVLADNGYGVRMSVAGVFIGNGDRLFDLGTEVPNFLTDFHEDLIGQQFERSSNDCPNVLEAQFNDRNELRLSRTTCKTKKNVIYGLRCRLCPDLRSGYRNVTYVGQTKYNSSNKYSLHNRVCLARKADVKKMISSESEMNRPFIEHVSRHLERGEGAGDLFGRAVDVVLFPTGDVGTNEKLRCWEVFWQWLMQVRKDQGGHSDR